MQMKKYLGTKLVQAAPMTRGSYNLYRGWAPPEGENQEVEGYLVEYAEGGAPNHIGHSGYISWSPKDVFQQSYRGLTGMSFGQAIEALKIGQKVARDGWNGKDMFIYLVGEGRYPPSTPAGLEIAQTQKDGKVPYRSYIAMKTVTGEVVPWLASQSDVLENDWMIVE